MASAAVAVAGLPPGSILLGTGIVCKDPNATAPEGSYPFQPAGYKLDLVKLESYFQSINKQLFETTVQVKECVHEKTYKEEITQRLELSRKIDGSVMDVNMIKDMIYSDGQVVLGQLRENKVQLLKGEVENLKMIIRRMEMQQAESLEVFSRLKKLEKSQIQFEDDFIAYKNSDLFSGIRGEVDKIKEDMIAKVGQERKDVDRQFLVFEAKLYHLQSSLKSGGSEKMIELEEKLKEIEKTLTEALEGDEVEEEDGEDAPTGAFRPRHLLHAAVKADINISETEERAELSEDSPSEEEEEDDILLPLPACAEEEEEVVPAAAARAPRNSMIQMPKNNANNISTIKESNTSSGSGAAFTDPVVSISSTGPPSAFGGGRKNRAASMMMGKGSTDGSSPVTGSSGMPGTLSSFPSSSSMMPHPGMMMKKKSSRKFSVQGGPSIEALKEKFIDNQSFKLWQQEVIHLRKDISKIHLKFHAMEGTSVIRIFRKYTVVKERQAIQSAFLKFQLNVLHKKKVAQLESDQMMKVFQHRILRFSDKRRLIIAFHRWSYVNYMLILGEQYRPWIKNKIQLWMDNTHPQLGEYMNRWKKFTLFSIRAMMLKTSTGKGQANDEDDEIDENLLPSTMVLNSMGTGQSTGGNVAAYTLDSLKKLAHLDLKARWKHQEKRAKEKEKHELLVRYMQKQLDAYRIQQQVEEVARNEKIHEKLHQVEGLFQKARQDVNKSIVTLDEQKSQLQQQTEQQINALLQQFTMYKSQVTLKFSYMKEEIDEEMLRLKERLDNDRKDLQQVLTDHQGIEKQLQRHEDWQAQMTEVVIPEVKTQFKQVQSSLQGLNNNHVESKARMATLEEQLDQVHHRVQDEVMKQLEQINHRFEDLQHFYDEELLWLKTIIKQNVKGVNDFKERYEIFVHETEQSIEGILNEESGIQNNDDFLQINAPLNKRMQRVMQDLKKNFIRYETWFMLFHDPSASHLLEAMLFPIQSTAHHQYQKASLTHREEMKLLKWKEHQQKIAMELSVLARKLAQQITTKCDFDVLSSTIRRKLLHILVDHPSNGGVVMAAPESEDGIMSDGKQINILHLRQKYLVNLSTILKEQLNHFDPHEVSLFHKSHHHMGIEFVKRKQRFVEHFVRMVETSLSSFPIIHQFSGQQSSLSSTNIKANFDTNQLSNAMIDYMNCMACNRPMVSALPNNTSPSKRTQASQRRPASASQPYMNRSAPRNHLVHSTSQPYFQPTSHAFMQSEDGHPLDLGEGVEASGSLDRVDKPSSASMKSGPIVIPGKDRNREDFMVSTSVSKFDDFYSSIASKCQADHDFEGSILNVSKAENSIYPTTSLDNAVDNLFCEVNDGKRELHITLNTPNTKKLQRVDSHPQYQPSPLPAPRLDLHTNEYIPPQLSATSFPSDFVPTDFELLDTYMKQDPNSSQPIPFALSAALENIQNGTINPQNYQHYSEKLSRSHSSTFADGFVVSHSALPQQIIVDSLSQLHPKDISIRPKHEDIQYEQLHAEDVGIESRKLYGTKQ